MVKELSIEEKKRFLFESIFFIYNKLEMASFRIQNEVSLKQFVLLSIILNSDRQLTLTELGEHMGCSRQNVKQLASNLQRKGYVVFLDGKRKAVHVVPTEKIKNIPKKLVEKQYRTLELYFSKLTEDEINTLFEIKTKLYEGVELVEEYSKEIAELEKQNI